MTTKQFTDNKGNTWEWEEPLNEEKKIKQKEKTIGELESEAPDYGVGK